MNRAAKPVEQFSPKLFYSRARSGLADYLPTFSFINIFSTFLLVAVNFVLLN